MPRIQIFKNTHSLGMVLLVCTAVLFLSHAAESENAVRDALDICAHVLIPSLFPFMVISSLFVQLGAAQTVGRPFAALFRRIFKLPECAAGAVVLGALCGFPVGAKTACDLHHRGDLSREDAERLIALANNTGPSFILEVIGTYYWHSRGFGILLYIVQILSALIIGAAAAHRHEIPRKEDTPLRAAPQAASLLACLGAAVSSSAQAMLMVCGFVVFFAAVAEGIRLVIGSLGLNACMPYIAVLLEFCTGSAHAASIGGCTGAFLTGMAVGWSGLSVFAQSQAFASAAGLRLRFAAGCKFIQGILCGAAAALWYAFFGRRTAVVCAVLPLGDMPVYALYIEIALLILFCLFPLPRRLTQNTTDDKAHEH